MSIININKNHIAIEGIDGCGKSSFIKKISDCKLFNNKNLMCDCSPFNPDVTKVIRKMLKNDYKLDKKVLHKDLLSLFMLDNHIHGKEITEEFLSKDENNVVISDRYIASSLAYQSLNAKMKDIIKLAKDYDDITCPGLILYFNITPKISLSRVEARGEEKEIFEKTDLLEKVKCNYEEAFKRLYKLTNGKVTIISIDASLPKDDVFALAYKVINEYLTYGGAFVQSSYCEEFNTNKEKIKYCKIIM